MFESRLGINLTGNVYLIEFYEATVRSADTMSKNFGSVWVETWRHYGIPRTNPNVSAVFR